MGQLAVLLAGGAGLLLLGAAFGLVALATKLAWGFLVVPMRIFGRVLIRLPLLALAVYLLLGPMLASVGGAVADLAARLLWLGLAALVLGAALVLVRRLCASTGAGRDAGQQQWWPS